MIKSIFYLLLISSFLFPVISEAQNRKRKRLKKTTISFEDELIRGEINKPDLMYLLRQKQFNYKKLLNLRDNFLNEMSNDAESVR